MYSWDGDTSSWYGSGRYAYSPKGAEEREDAARRSALAGGRTYETKSGPNPAMVDAKKRLTTTSKNPMVIAVDVTGSMARWPFEIFDRLPLLYNTLAQYRDDLQVVFAAIGDAGVDRWPIQVTDFAKGYDLEQQLGALWGEGGGGDAPESYGLFAQWLLTHVETPNAAEPPFLIVFGDAPMHEKVPKAQIQKWLGDGSGIGFGVNAIDTWQKLGQKWNTWFLRRPTGKKGDEVHVQWAKAVGEKKILTIDDEQRAVDYAMGIVARAWGHFDDFKNNMRARQPEDKVEELSKPIAMICPRCGGPIPVDAPRGLFKCGYCGMTLKI